MKHYRIVAGLTLATFVVFGCGQQEPISPLAHSGQDVFLSKPALQGGLVLNVHLDGITETSQLGQDAGEPFSVEFMLDTSLPNVSTDPQRELFIDPWMWCWIVGTPWDWLFGFTIEIPTLSTTEDDVMLVTAAFDSDDDQVMGLPPGSSFVTTLVFDPGTLNSLPGPEAFPCKSGTLKIFLPDGTPVFCGDIVGGGATIVVDVDIKPGSDPNSINLKSNGVIPVAILTTDFFDATTVDGTTVQFGPNGASPVHGEGHLEDVDEDGDLDWVGHFKTKQTGIAAGDTQATIKGKTTDGFDFSGEDSVNLVGK